MTDWCWTYDPRNVGYKLPALMPWIPWQKQIDFIEWFYYIYLNGKRGLVEKSRDAGATWLFCFVFLREWRWEQGFAAGFGSRKFTLVEERDNPKAIFSKLRQLLYNQPTWWMPKDFNRNTHDKLANLINPEMSSNIAGEGGDDIGRGDRRMVYVVDEKAFVEHQENADAALSQTTNVQFDLSTPNGMNHFGQKRMSGKVNIFTFDWRDDIRKDGQWYQKQKNELDSVVLAQEVDHDYYCSVENLFIDPKHVRAAINLKLEKGGMRSSGLDVAAGGENNSSVANRSGPYVKVIEKDFDNGIDLSFWAKDEVVENKSQYLNYDKIGVGYAVSSAYNKMEDLPFKFYGINSGDTPSDTYYPEFGKTGKEMFHNARAEWWYLLAKRFQKTYEYVVEKVPYPHEELISIENDSNLEAQLSSVKKIRKENGKIKAESKDEMLKRGVKSPDSADAVVMAFIPQNAGNRFVWFNFDRLNMLYKGKLEWINCYNICSFFISKDMVLSLICANWNREEKVLSVYGEVLSKDILISDISKTVVKGAVIQNRGMRWFLSNSLAEDDYRKSISQLLKKQINKDLASITSKRVNIKEPQKYNRIGSIGLINEMFKDGSIVFNSNCTNIIEQVNGWYIEGSKPKEGYGLCEALCQIVSELNRTEKIKPAKKPIDSYRVLDRSEPTKKKNMWAAK